MKWGNEHIGGKETGPVRFVLAGDQQAAFRLQSQARIILGEFKKHVQQQTNNSTDTRYTHKVERQDGSAIVVSTVLGSDGYHDTDVALIYVPIRKTLRDGLCRCLGFIVRITTTTQSYLMVNVKEPDLTTGINNQFFTDWNDWWGGAFYDIATFDEISEFYGFEMTYNFMPDDSIVSPTLEGEAGYVMTEYGPQYSVIKAGVSEVFPGTVTFDITKTSTFTWFTESWIGTYPGVGLAARDAYKDAWEECFSSANPSWVGSEDAATHNDNYAATQNYVNNEVFVYGFAPCIIAQDTVDPISRYYCSDYRIDGEFLIVKAIQANSDFNMFAVCWPGVKKYKVEDDLKSYTIYDTQTHTVPVPDLVGGSGGLIWGGTEGPDWLYVTHGIPTGTVFGLNYEGSKIDNYVNTYEIDSWQMKTEVKGGDYIVTITCDYDNDEHDVDIDVLFAGTELFQTFKYSDIVANGKSINKAVIHVGREFEYVDGMPNPFITISSND